MPIINTASDIAPLLQHGARLLCLDLGTKTIGLALSDKSRVVATPLRTIKRTKFNADANHLAKLVADSGVGALVVGLPLNMNGTEGPRCQSTRDFARNLAQVIDRPITFWDERLSTAAVERVLIKEADLSRKRRGKLVDNMAAAVILQSFLDFLRHRTD